MGGFGSGRRSGSGRDTVSYRTVPPAVRARAREPYGLGWRRLPRSLHSFPPSGFRGHQPGEALFRLVQEDHRVCSRLRAGWTEIGS